METEQVKKCNHIVGSTRTIHTAVLTVEYLKSRLAAPFSEIRPDQISYRFKDATRENGFWSADILVTTYGDMCFSLPNDLGTRFVETCRAFVAGRGEIW